MAQDNYAKAFVPGDKPVIKTTSELQGIIATLSQQMSTYNEKYHHFTAGTQADISEDVRTEALAELEAIADKVSTLTLQIRQETNRVLSRLTYFDFGGLEKFAEEFSVFGKDRETILKESPKHHTLMEEEPIPRFNPPVFDNYEASTQTLLTAARLINDGLASVRELPEDHYLLTYLPDMQSMKKAADQLKNLLAQHKEIEKGRQFIKENSLSPLKKMMSMALAIFDGLFDTTIGSGYQKELESQKNIAAFICSTKDGLAYKLDYFARIMPSLSSDVVDKSGLVVLKDSIATAWCSPIHEEIYLPPASASAQENGQDPSQVAAPPIAPKAFPWRKELNKGGVTK